MQPSSFDFAADVLERSQSVPVLVDFWAPWCGPCRMLGPVLEQLASEAAGRWELVKINTDEHQDLAFHFGLRGIPDVRLFHRGEIIAQFSGALPAPHVRRWLEEHLPSSRREIMARARESLRAGHARDALAALQPLHRAEPHDDELTTLTARALVFSAPADALALVDRLPASSPWEQAITVVRTFARLFAQQDQPSPAVASSPYCERYLAAIQDLRREQFEDALINLIAILQAHPEFDTGLARATGYAIFQHLGLRHPLSEKYSRAFAMAVNA